MALLEFHNVNKTYRSDVFALTDINLSVNEGEVFGIVGHSGAGKSTLIRLINLLERPTGGSILIDGQDITCYDGKRLREARRKIGMIFQHFNLLSSKTVAENVAFPLKLAGVKNKFEIERRVVELLDRVGLHDHFHKYPAQLSGGQKQRVGIARALACNPKILLCDEATSALDPQTTQSVLKLLNEINQELKLTIVLITHEMNVIRSLCDRVAVLDGGHIVETGEVSEVFLNPKHPVTQKFVLESVDLDEDALKHACAKVKGKIVRLTYQGDASYEPVLSRVTREANIDFCIVAGRVDRIKHAPYGQLIVALDGEHLDEAMSRLTREGLRVEVLS
jgi:D-methionine transport system ATP-binding protein